jgi:hydroxymethylglutaryl-CoA reductase (NADPH)
VEAPPGLIPVDLVPRFRAQGYARADVTRRRQWLEQKVGVRFDIVGRCAVPTEEMRGNIENPIGTVQMPLGVAGPLLVHGDHACGMFYVPLATTEGALVRSYERGMVTLTRAGGVTTRVEVDENRVCPVFMFDSVAESSRFVQTVDRHIYALRAEAESTTRHGRLVRLESRQVGRDAIVAFCYTTGDAHGMNMIVRATDEACQWLVSRGHAPAYQLFSGLSSEKRASQALWRGGKGKTVIAGARLSASVTRTCLHTTPDALARVWHRSAVGHFIAGSVGCNAQVANGLTALFVACGQDVANVANAHAGITDFDVTANGDLYASVTLPSLTVATVGGGTALGTSRECLALLGCAGSGHAARFAEIAAATVLAGELSMAAAIASGEFVGAHEQYGRNRPSVLDKADAR